MKFALFLLLTLMTCPAAASDLAIGSVSFQLGESETSARAKLVDNFGTTPLSTPDDLVVWDKSKRTSLGSISFKNGRVKFVSRTWGHFSDSDSPLKAALALTAAIESATDRAGPNSRISVETNRQPGGELRTTKFIFPSRKVELVVADSVDFGRQVSIFESISM